MDFVENLLVQLSVSGGGLVNVLRLAKVNETVHTFLFESIKRKNRQYRPLARANGRSVALGGRLISPCASRINPFSRVATLIKIQPDYNSTSGNGKARG